MREKLKTGVLLLLILVSFQLTSMFWLSVGVRMPLVVSPVSYTPVIQDTPPSLYVDLFAPLFIYAHSGSNHYQLRPVDASYKTAWNWLKAAIAAVDAPADGQAVLESISLQSWQQALGSSLEFRYSGQLELNYWWLVASKSTLLKFSLDQLFFDRILIPLNGSAVYFRNLQTGQVWRWQWNPEREAQLIPDLGKLALTTAQRAREVPVPEGVTVVPQAGLYASRRTTSLPEILAVLPYDEDDKAGIVRQFFSITPRMPKTEVLENGAVVQSYITAKQQVLRLHNTGLLEYTETVNQPGAAWSSTEQLEQASSFIANHGGWPKAVVTDGIAQMGNGYRFNFVQLYGGYPLVDLLPNTLAVQVSPEGIRSYTRKIYQVLQDGYFPYELRSAEDALRVAGAELYGRQVADIYLGYYQCDYTAFDPDQPFLSEPMYLYPVWVIELSNGQQLLVHAFNLLNDPGVIKPE